MSDETKNILGKKAIHQERLRTMTGLYTTVDRMITGRRISVEATDNLTQTGPVTETGQSRLGGETILFNTHRLNEDDLNKVERLHGLNFHEVAKSEYSMGYPSRADQDNKAAFQTLEAARVDNLFTATHQATGDWLSASVMRWVTEIKNPADLAKVHLSSHGRDFLPQDFREGAAQMFEAEFGAEALAEFNDVIDTYNDLVLPRDKEEALQLASRYEGLCRQYFQQSASQQPDPFDSGKQGEQNNTRQKSEPKQSTSSQQKAQRRRQDQQEEQDDQGQQAGQGQGEDGDGEDEQDSQGQGQGGQQGDEGDQDGQGGGQGQDQGEDGDEDGQGASQGQPGDEEGKGQGGKGEGEQQGQPGGQGIGRGAGNAAITDPRQLAQQALDTLMQSEEMQSEIQRTRQTIFKAKPADRLEVCKYRNQPVSSGLVSASRQFEREMRKIRDVVEPGWNRRTDSGRINAGRFLREGNRETAFDSWDEGQMEAIDIETVILADMSGSMGGAMTKTLEIIWGLKRALDTIDASTTVILYDEDAKFLYKSNEKASKTTMRYFMDGGGTEATEGVYQSAMILASSKRSVKVLIVLTDGEWGYYKTGYNVNHPRHPDSLIARMSKAGYITALGYINTGGSTEPIDKVKSHGCEIKQSLTVEGLGQFGRAIVRGAISKKLVRK